MKLMQSKRKLVVQSRVSDKAVKRIKAEAKQKINAVARPPKGITEARAILNYNAFVMGEHNYYKMATGVCIDFRDIGYEADKTRAIGAKGVSNRHSETSPGNQKVGCKQERV